LASLIENRLRRCSKTKKGDPSGPPFQAEGDHEKLRFVDDLLGDILGPANFADAFLT
jgi:hypothetical protein